ncbi:PemK-like, MazF-like toxin of type II toxin-antitoxin system [Antricoccus suffuscus]|uniref:PemK-like, MazF-like toxin of type II toxin-antitoxin system n=1 Tax=Antricoccus suffuscus TaxID=1629062 RepID=A0A2T1A3L0_9ACTN|nr:type II toxin-antitoxin system PemK/MazF family toxin [Antricoccus suffuscus]PRZ43195.1 PemK-like, MazF-like toxin of type II toxin-antitoxin system [Antricoccus suffuscus]
MSIKSTLKRVLGRGGNAPRQRADEHHKPLTGASPRPPKETIAISEARPQIAYAPEKDGDADPGEVVWTWVPYEEDASQGKDRPVVVIGRIGADVAALMLTTKRHDTPTYFSIGNGPWDSSGRPSWVRLDRVLRLEPDQIRREGAVLDRTRFDQVVGAFAHGGR